ncbi:ninjurin-2-like [Anopheles ziemanni]|uniref:ninjurin-2-like n=1 Tax=Anopheles coustani TaxID=139045 RepID=UPI002659B798|nr:ninjurin-2-like [Anopheles coustani]XP_058169968.1 ninjurin-2-like [Anopheles ziemanni]
MASTELQSEVRNKQDMDRPDISTREMFSSIKGLNLNSYATRKSIAQGMLDLALLTANASQLKYILTVGETHEFYHFLLVLIIISISLQIFQALLIIVLAIVFDINKVEEQKRSDIVNNVLIAVTAISVVVNVIISAFDMKSQADVLKLN